MRYITLLFLLFVTTYSFAQINISGTIKDQRNRGLPGVSISLADSYDGATSDSSGYYYFTTTEQGEHVIKVTATGFKDYSQKVNLGSAHLKIDIYLKEKITALKAVVISAGAFIAGDQKKATALSSLDVVTTANANGDITGAIKTLPGTQQVGETEGLFVRGGTASETKYFIDGSLVNNFFYSSEPGMATRGRFNPFLFTGTTFSSGGYSALYGQALSSVLLMQSIDLPDKTSASFGISYLAANAGFQKLAKNKRSSWGVTYSYTNLALVYGMIKQKFDYFRIPIVHQGDWNYRRKTKHGMVKYYGMASHTDVGFRQQDVDSPVMKNAFALKNFNLYQNITWRENIGKGWQFHLGGSFTNNRDNITTEFQDDAGQKQIIRDDPLYANKNFKLVAKGSYINTKLVMEKKLSGLSALRFGTENNYSKERSDFLDYAGISYSGDLEEDIWAGFAETDIYLTNQLAAKTGARVEHSKWMEKWNVAQRASLAYQFPDKSQASLAYGIFYQNPENKYLPAMQALHFQEAIHYIAQYQKISPLQTFRLEAFYKKYDDLIKTTGFNTTPKALNNKGFGDASGVEIFWRDKKSLKNFDYWISYSYLDTKRDFLNYPQAMRPDYAAKHTASLVLKKFIMPIKTQFNASYTFATPRPFYNLTVDPNGKFFIKEKGITKPYHDLSLSINYVPAVGNAKARSFTVIVFSLTNVLGAKNVYAYRFSANGENKAAVTPPARRFLFIGCFISLGIDRTEDVINNHL